MNIPIVDLAKQYKKLEKEIDAAVKRVLSSGGYILGKTVSDFEDSIAVYLQCRFGIGLNSGTDALEMALRALDIGEGDEVIVPAFTFMASALAVTSVGATPVFADIDETSFCIDAKDAADRITKKTKAIMLVHLYGQPCDMDELVSLAKDAKLKVIEDCAQSIGAEYNGKKVGSFGDAGCFSFYPTKNLGAYGDGGAVLTSNPQIRDKIKLLRNYGTEDKIHYNMFGRNSRLDAIQAAILSVKLAHIDSWNQERSKRAGWYRRLIAESGCSQIGIPQELPDRKHVYHLFVVRVNKRDLVLKRLNDEGIGAMAHYPRALHIDSIYSKKGTNRDLDRAEAASRQVLALPLCPEIDLESMKTVVNRLVSIINSLK